MEADRLAAAFEHGRAEIIVQRNAGHALKGGKGGDMAAQEIVHALIQIEAQKKLAAEAQHHDEGHQRAFGATDREIAEVTPVDLTLFTWQRLQAQVGLGWPTRSQLRDMGAKLTGAAGVAARLGHTEQARGTQGRVLRQRLEDQRVKGVDDRRPPGALGLRQAGLRQDPVDGRVMDPQLPGDGIHTPLLDEVIAQDLGFEGFVDHRVAATCQGG